MSKIQLKEFLTTKKKLIENLLSENLNPENVEPKIINDAMKYSVFNGGKRLRPILVLLGNALFNGNENNAYSSAVAVEFIHCYSLVHDDLPALDNDDYRRGKLTCHKKFKEDIAILTGDALLTKAFEVLATKTKDTQILVNLLQELTAAVGERGMIGGQVMDLESENIDHNHNFQNNKKLSLDEKYQILKYIHKNKTSKLIEASLVLGAITANASSTNIENLRKYGDCLGMMFQVTDDILDITADKEKLGKRGSDIDNNKLTYPALFGLEKSKEIVEELKINGSQFLNQIEPKNEETNIVLLELLNYIAERSY